MSAILGEAKLMAMCNHVLSAIVTKNIYIYSLFGILSFIYVLPGIWFPINQCTLPVFNLYLLCI